MAFEKQGTEEIVAPLLNGQVEARLRDILREMLSRYNRLDLEEALALCLLELAINASKANAKAAYFAEHEWDIHNAQQYQNRFHSFKTEVLERDWSREYLRNIEKRNLFVRIALHQGADELLIEVINNAPMCAADETRIKEKYQKARGYERLVDFYADHQDQTEGEGLGFALMMLALKKAKIDPGLLNVSSDDSQTVASLRVPMKAPG